MPKFFIHIVVVLLISALNADLATASAGWSTFSRVDSGMRHLNQSQFNVQALAEVPEFLQSLLARTKNSEIRRLLATYYLSPTTAWESLNATISRYEDKESQLSHLEGIRVEIRDLAEKLDHPRAFEIVLALITDVESVILYRMHSPEEVATKLASGLVGGESGKKMWEMPALTTLVPPPALYAPTRYLRALQDAIRQVSPMSGQTKAVQRQRALLRALQTQGARLLLEQGSELNLRLNAGQSQLETQIQYPIALRRTRLNGRGRPHLNFTLRLFNDFRDSKISADGACRIVEDRLRRFYPEHYWLLEHFKGLLEQEYLGKFMKIFQEETSQINPRDRRNEVRSLLRLALFGVKPKRSYRRRNQAA
jgi:hypothetical protein